MILKPGDKVKFQWQNPVHKNYYEETGYFQCWGNAAMEGRSEEGNIQWTTAIILTLDGKILELQPRDVKLA